MLSCERIFKILSKIYSIESLFWSLFLPFLPAAYAPRLRAGCLVDRALDPFGFSAQSTAFFTSSSRPLRQIDTYFFNVCNPCFRGRGQWTRWWRVRGPSSLPVKAGRRAARFPPAHDSTRHRGPINPKAISVILTTQNEFELVAN